MFRFENLEIWKRSMDITESMFDIADQLEGSRKYKFAEQLRSAALSKSNNIAEGSGSSSKYEFRQFLNYSHRSVSETANMLILSYRKNYITNELKLIHLNQLEEISRMIIGFSKKLS